MDKRYTPSEIEPKWQKIWQEKKIFATPDAFSKDKNIYILDMFPYPSGAGLHVGHPIGYIASDIYSRYQRMKGYNVLHPMGWDAFGLPAENYAIKTGVHPAITTIDNIKIFTRQIKRLGLSYDWDREINTSTPDYYKWTQWLFLKLYEKGLAYRKKAPVNWCGSCQTVLANEQVKDGKCERCESVIIQKYLEQWFLKITDYAAQLLHDIDALDWQESIKIMQRNWIGKSEGAEIEFRIKDSKLKVNVFTTRPDTLFGATFMVLAPEHHIIDRLKENITNYNEIIEYRNTIITKTDIERGYIEKIKTGVIINGISAINPINNEEIPIYCADFVLMTYGTGAIMSVPAHDERDFEFAKKYDINIRRIIERPRDSGWLYIHIHDEDHSLFANKIIEKSIKLEYVTPTIAVYKFPSDLLGDISNLTVKNKVYGLDDIATIIENGGFTLEMKPPRAVLSQVYTGDGKHIQSEFLNGLNNITAIRKITEVLESKKIGKSTTIYKLRDWLISRQRYWGAPIPIIYCDICGTVPIPENELPVELPTDVDFKPTGESPLFYSKTFHNVLCPKCQSPAQRESDTMDSFVDSSWYFLRYIDPNNKTEFGNKDLITKWAPVDMYVGGAEHAVLHLLYARFITKALRDLGYLKFSEPFSALRNQGLILSEDGRKMSKSLGNVVNPDDIVNKFGADAFRLHEMFMGPFEDVKPWSTSSIMGVYRFLEKIWRIGNSDMSADINNNRIQLSLNKLVIKVESDIKSFSFNTAIAAFMAFLNEAMSSEINKRQWHDYLILLSPFAPHICEELWQILGNKDSIFRENWVNVSKTFSANDNIAIIVQINNKVRGSITINDSKVSEYIILDKIKLDKSINKYLIGDYKVIKYIPGEKIIIMLT